MECDSLDFFFATDTNPLIHSTYAINNSSHGTASTDDIEITNYTESHDNAQSAVKKDRFLSRIKNETGYIAAAVKLSYDSIAHIKHYIPQEAQNN